MNPPYTPPALELQSFNCPNCGSFALQRWTFAVKATSVQSNAATVNRLTVVADLRLATCDHCAKESFWLDKKMIYPYAGSAPLPNSDMPEDIRKDYLEARGIASTSPRGAAALLRLAIQKLCVHLGAQGKNINEDIAQLVKQGLPQRLQQALDSVRVVGNNAVHPGTIDLDDDVSIVNKLFVFLNIIVDNQISQHKMIDAYYQDVIPEHLRDAIDRRDNRP